MEARKRERADDAQPLGNVSPAAVPAAAVPAAVPAAAAAAAAPAQPPAEACDLLRLNIVDRLIDLGYAADIAVLFNVLPRLRDVFEKDDHDLVERAVQAEEDGWVSRHYVAATALAHDHDAQAASKLSSAAASVDPVRAAALREEAGAHSARAEQHREKLKLFDLRSTLQWLPLACACGAPPVRFCRGCQVSVACAACAGRDGLGLLRRGREHGVDGEDGGDAGPSFYSCAEPRCVTERRCESCTEPILCGKCNRIFCCEHARKCRYNETLYFDSEACGASRCRRCAKSKEVSCDAPGCGAFCCTSECNSYNAGHQRIAQCAGCSTSVCFGESDVESFGERDVESPCARALGFVACSACDVYDDNCHGGYEDPSKCCKSISLLCGMCAVKDDAKRARGLRKHLARCDAPGCSDLICTHCKDFRLEVKSNDWPLQMTCASCHCLAIGVDCERAMGFSKPCSFRYTGFEQKAACSACDLCGACAATLLPPIANDSVTCHSCERVACPRHVAHLGMTPASSLGSGSLCSWCKPYEASLKSLGAKAVASAAASAAASSSAPAASAALQASEAAVEPAALAPAARA